MLVLRSTTPTAAAGQTSVDPLAQLAVTGFRLRFCMITDVDPVMPAPVGV